MSVYPGSKSERVPCMGLFSLSPIIVIILVGIMLELEFI